MKGKAFLGELIGTFLLVLFGTGSVAVAVLYGEYTGIFQIAILWGTAVTLGIYATRHLCDAHFNPAVTFAMAATGRLNKGMILPYLAGQFVGAFVASLTVYGTFASKLVAFEAENNIIRGTIESRLSAKMFGEYYYLGVGEQTVSMPLAMFAEGMGTFILVLMIFILTERCNKGKPDGNMVPLFIGLTLASCIALFGPLTQAGFNPARDFAPRMVALIFGWGSAVWTDNCGGFFWVYMLAPIIGGLLAGLLFTKVIQKSMEKVEEA
ncbi:MAG: aquaporin [Firmicutes bacterium]|nr:aquaporin [Bacillota bacterium]